MSTPSLRRRLAAIMSIDVVSYSKMMGEDEEGTLRLLDTHRAYIDNSIRNHQGRIANTAGDSVLAEFASPSQAVRCAVDIQDSVERLNSKLAADRHMRFRVGVHLDDVIVQANGDLIGEGVNIAARLQGAVEPGGISVSGEVVTQARARLADISFEPMGETMLKNIARAVEAYRVVKETGVRGRTAVGMTVRTAAPHPIPAAPRQSFAARWRLAITLSLCLMLMAGALAYFLLRESPAVIAERAAWEQLRQTDSILGIQQFLEAHPKGANSDAARARLAVLETERLVAERARAEEADRLAREKARAEAEAEQRRRQEAEARRQEEEARAAAKGARVDEAMRVAAERQRREDMQQAQARRQAAALRREKRLEGTRNLEFKPMPCAQSKIASTTGLSCSASAIYDGHDGKGRFRRWAASAHGGNLSTYIVAVEAVDANSVHDPVTKDDEELFLSEISNVTRNNVVRWSDVEASALGFVAPFVTSDQGNCAAFTKPGPARGQGLAWVVRGYICVYGGQTLSAEQIRSAIAAQRIN